MPTVDNWRALREALEAGPTEGERFIQDASPWTDAEGKFVQFEAFNISAGSADRSSEDYYRIASVSNINDAPCNKANAMLFAAAHPAAIRSLLDERDRLAAEVAALREDAERRTEAARHGFYESVQFIRRKANDYAEAFGTFDPDTGAFEFKREPQQEYFQTLYELADEIEQLAARTKGDA